MNATAPPASSDLTAKPDLGTVIAAYHEVTEQFRETHVRLEGEVRRLTDELERKNQELARREQMAALGEVAASLAHEIRNPLSGLRLFAALLTRPDTEPAQVRDLAGKILQGLRTLEGTVNDILLFARQGCYQPGDQDLAELLKEALRGIEHLAQARQVPLELQPPERPSTVWADRIQLLRALGNLLSNAIEASQPGQQVTLLAVPAAQRPGQVEIRVQDQGPGIPAADRRRIFDPFYTTKSTGTGLGLPMVQRIVENHGGTLELQDAPGGGACFRLTLPPPPQPQSSEHSAWPTSA